MTLTFEIGDEARPRGHAVLYFGSPEAGLLATYVVLLPIKMDVGKYLPPLLAAQLGGMAGGVLGEGAGGFAVPPVPEEAASVESLRRLAELRGDDLLWGGSIVLGDVQSALHQTAESVQEYAGLYQRYLDASPGPAPQPAIEQDGGGSEVQQVLYELMGDRDRLAELSKLVGTMRFALETNDDALIRETDASLGALAGVLPERFWGDRVREAARDPERGATDLIRLYIDRCYKLIDEDFTAVDALEREIAARADEEPPHHDLRT